MKPTRISTLVIIAVVCAAVGWLLLRAVYAKLPPLPWTAVPALLIAAVAEAWMGRDIKARISRRGRRRLRATTQPAAARAMKTMRAAPGQVTELSDGGSPPSCPQNPDAAKTRKSPPVHAQKPRRLR